MWTMAGNTEDYLRNTSIFHFLPQNYLPFEWGVMKFTIFRLLTLKMLQTKFGQDWPCISWEEDVTAWRTTTDPNPIGHLSDLGDLKIWNSFRTGYTCTTWKFTLSYFKYMYKNKTFIKTGLNNSKGNGKSVKTRSPWVKSLTKSIGHIAHLRKSSIQ